MSHIHIPFIASTVWIHGKHISKLTRIVLPKNKVSDKIHDWIENKMGRKLLLLYIVLGLATAGTFLPPLVSWLVSLYKSQSYPRFEILGSTEWVTMVSLLVTSFFGAAHMDKRLGVGVQTNQSNVVSVKTTPDEGQGQQTVTESLSKTEKVGVSPVNQTTEIVADANDADKQAAIDALKHGN